MVGALAILGQQGEEIEFQDSVPVKELGVGVVLLKLHQLDGVAAYHLSLEVVIHVGILGIHDGCGRVGLDGVAEHTPVGVVAVDDTRGHIEADGEETAFGGVHHRRTRAILLAARTQVDTIGLAVVGADTVVAALVSSADGQCVLLGEAGACHSVEPVVIAAEVDTTVAPAQTYLAVVFGSHHVEFLVDNIPRQGARIGGMGVAILAAFLGGHENHTV